MAVIVKTCKHCGKDFKSKSTYLAHLPCKEMIDSPDFENAHRVWVAHYNVHVKYLEKNPYKEEFTSAPKGGT